MCLLHFTLPPAWKPRMSEPYQVAPGDVPAAKRQALDSELHDLRAAERRTQREFSQQRRRESALVLRLALKDRECVEAWAQCRSLRQALQPSYVQETSLLLDPAVNAEIMRLREEVELAKKKEQDAKDELQACQFQSGSIPGKKLMNKCKELQAENDQLGKELSEGQVQKLKADCALQKQHAQELQKALEETREFVEHLTEELDTSQALVFSLRRELHAAKSQLAAAQPSAAAPAATE